MFRVYPENIHRIHDIVRRVWQALPGVGLPLHRNEPYRPFFVIGSGRCGTTLLRRILNSNPRLHVPPENSALGHVIKLFRQNSGLRWPDLVALILGQFAFRSQFRAFETSMHPLLEELRASPKGCRSLALILHSFYQYHAEKHNKAAARWGDKTPLNTFCLERIRSVFPRAQFIHMIRDGCDVVASMLQQGRYRKLEEACERWSRSVKLARSFGSRRRDTMIEVRYEDLVTDPEPVVRKTCAFLDIQFDPCMLAPDAARIDMPDVALRPHLSNVANPISTASIGKGRRQLGQAEKERLQELIGHQLAGLGYAPAHADCSLGGSANEPERPSSQ